METAKVKPHSTFPYDKYTVRSLRAAFPADVKREWPRAPQMALSPALQKAVEGVLYNVYLQAPLCLGDFYMTLNIDVEKGVGSKHLLKYKEM